ncbi:FecR family protein [Paraburkholderia sp. BL27I4N3]|uniref:FecR family protein n=1 Tax=Paraburkholderia sp. BL27I4N3 TaxID=1938805 RepID=UPI002163522F|nr:FecR family protein [Paraburkholderia sp. BL27I4N3]
MGATFFLYGAANAQPVTLGNAVVVIGKACAQHAQADCVPLSRGAAIAQGDTVETGVDGYVYITTVDHGFISVRPDSSLTFERYEYDPAEPQKTVIKLSLHKGVVREISGTGAQAARDHYRMNTPVAALGVRGTDFTVFTDANVTRADVRSGGIVMTPLGAGCAATGTGPCEGPTAAQLFAGQPNAVLQVYRGNAHPVVVDSALPSLIPEQAAAALKNEENSARAAIMQPVNPGVAPAELSFPLTVPAAPSGPATTPAPPLAPPGLPPAQPPESQQIFWGRFAPLAAAPSDTTLAALLQQGSDQLGLLTPFAMTRTPQTDMVMPTFGTFTFELQASSAYVMNTATGTATQAQISKPFLSVNFGASTFQTSLSLSANGTNYAVSAQGGVGPDGKLHSNYGSQATVLGGLAGKNATQAGYLFLQSLDGKNTAVGATQWSR